MRMPDFIEDHPVISSILGIIIAIFVIIIIIIFICNTIRENERKKLEKEFEEEENKKAEAQRLIDEKTAKKVQENRKKTEEYVGKNSRDIREIFSGKKLNIVTKHYNDYGTIIHRDALKYDNDLKEFLLNHGLSIWIDYKDKRSPLSKDETLVLDYLLEIDVYPTSIEDGISESRIRMRLTKYPNDEFVGRTEFQQITFSDINIHALEWFYKCLKRQTEKDASV